MCDTKVTNMAVQTMWIRKHMLQSPCSDLSYPERQMSENEMRVLRSIQKLSIPDWYLNSSSRPPKILSNNTPIDRRPAAWKNLSVKKSSVPKTTIAQPENSTVSHNGVLETEIESSSKAIKNYGTYKINRNSPTKKSPVKQSVASKNQSPGDKSPGKSRVANNSQTFPRVSPCRKIQNINIVFPNEIENQKRLMITDLDDCRDRSIEDMSKDSLNEEKSEMNDRDRVTAWDTHDKLYDKNFLPERASTPDASQQDTIETVSDLNTTLRKANRRPSLSISSISFANSSVEATLKAENDETKSQKSPLPIRASDAVNKCPEDPSTRKITVGKENKRPVTSQPKKVAALKRQQCVSCNTPITSQIATSSTRTSSFRPKTMLPPIPEKSAESVQFIDPPKIHSEKPRDRNIPSRKIIPTIPFFNAPIKSADLNKREKKVLKPSELPRTSLVRDIIEELNQRCKISPKSTLVSPSSKNFVKKLVRALETGVTDKTEEPKVSYKKITNRNDAEEFRDEDVFIDSENSSEDEIKSVAISTSISYKGTDSSSNSSSDTDPESPTIKYNYDDLYNWNSMVHDNKEPIVRSNNNDDQTTINENSEETETNDEDEWMYWIQKNEWNLPRTSSLLSVVSRVSSNNVDPSYRCISPIDRSNDRCSVFSSRSGRLSSNGWDTVYRTSRNHIDGVSPLNKTTVLDSGYSDRSSSSPSSYTEDKHFFDYTGTTQTASETDFFQNDSVSSDRKRGRIHGRPIII